MVFPGRVAYPNKGAVRIEERRWHGCETEFSIQGELCKILHIIIDFLGSDIATQGRSDHNLLNKLKIN